MEIGQYNVLTVKRREPNGVYLSEDGSDKEVLLPKKFVNDKMVEGTKGRVFLYADSEDRLIATTQKPLAVAGEVACLVVKDVTPIGAFLDWGLDKDLFLPFAEQKGTLVSGQKWAVYVYVDRANGRIVATQNLQKFIKNREVNLKEHDEVEIVVVEETEVGFKVVINNRHWGMFYKNETFEPVQVGDKRIAYVKRFREDGKIDVALQKQGLAAAGDARELILDKLRAGDGKLMLSDKSSPEEIYALLQLSKKNFKKAIGMLYKEQKIVIEPDHIHLP